MKLKARKGIALFLVVLMAFAVLANAGFARENGSNGGEDYETLLLEYGGGYVTEFVVDELTVELSAATDTAELAGVTASVTVKQICAEYTAVTFDVDISGAEKVLRSVQVWAKLDESAQLDMDSIAYSAYSLDMALFALEHDGILYENAILSFGLPSFPAVAEKTAFSASMNFRGSLPIYIHEITLFVCDGLGGVEVLTACRVAFAPPENDYISAELAEIANFMGVETLGYTSFEVIEQIRTRIAQLNARLAETAAAERAEDVPPNSGYRYFAPQAAHDALRAAIDKAEKSTKLISKKCQ